MGCIVENFRADLVESVSIDYLARDMIELSGLKVGEDIQIEYTGLRPGERLYEDLFADTEHPELTEHEKIFVNCNGFVSHTEDFATQLEALIRLAFSGQDEPTRTLLRKMALGE